MEQIKLERDDQQTLGEFIGFTVEHIIKSRIDAEIDKQVINFREKLESRKDEYLAEIMKGIRVAHETCVGEVNYKIIFENVVKHE